MYGAIIIIYVHSHYDMALYMCSYISYCTFIYYNNFSTILKIIFYQTYDPTFTPLQILDICTYIYICMYYQPGIIYSKTNKI